MASEKRLTSTYFCDADFANQSHTPDLNVKKTFTSGFLLHLFFKSKRFAERKFIFIKFCFACVISQVAGRSPK